MVTHAAVLDLTNLANDLGRAAKDVPKEMDRMLVRVGNIVLMEMTRIVPVDTGRLKASIALQSSPGRVVVGPQGVEYATYVEFGTKPHVIKSKTGRQAQHPGQKAQPYARPAAEKALDSLGTDAARVGVEMITGKVKA